jgi:glycosyltransferase involved in cell wall biosynthesis
MAKGTASMTAGPKEDAEGMYLVLPVPFRMIDGRLHAEAQAANGLDRWAEGFDRLTVAAPLVPEDRVADLDGFVWRDVATIEHHDRVRCQPLPWAYSPQQFAKTYKSTRALIASSIAQAKYLQFAIGGLVGDWALVAALEAIRQKRRYAVHTDRVEHEVVRETAGGKSSIRRIKNLGIIVPLMVHYHRRVIEQCSLGLWHGDNCYRAYSPWCRENHLVHDIHTKEADLVDAPELERKIDDVLHSETLKICYTGRLSAMKAPLDWLRAIAAARHLGARLEAVWYGEGPMLEETLAEAARLNLNDVVQFPGFVAGRSELLGRVRDAHMLVFTHITPESPRNLIEAFVSGTPIVGYENAYAAELMDPDGGGVMVPIHDNQALGQAIAELASDRPRLAELLRQAARTGRRFTDTAVFTERVNLLKQFA